MWKSRRLHTYRDLPRLTQTYTDLHRPEKTCKDLHILRETGRDLNRLTQTYTDLHFKPPWTMLVWKWICHQFLSLKHFLLLISLKSEIVFAICKFIMHKFSQNFKNQRLGTRVSALTKFVKRSYCEIIEKFNWESSQKFVQVNFSIFRVGLL